MSRLEGKRVPQAKAGVWALTERFWTMAGVAENCNARREDAFIEWAKGAL